MLGVRVTIPEDTDRLVESKDAIPFVELVANVWVLLVTPTTLP